MDVMGETQKKEGMDGMKCLYEQYIYITKQTTARWVSVEPRAHIHLIGRKGLR